VEDLVGDGEVLVLARTPRQQVSLLKAAQCGQATEAYSATSTLACGLPMVMSSGPGAPTDAPDLLQAASVANAAAAIMRWRLRRAISIP
jgi:hypothetical protein